MLQDEVKSARGGDIVTYLRLVPGYSSASRCRSNLFSICNWPPGCVSLDEDCQHSTDISALT